MADPIGGSEMPYGWVTPVRFRTAKSPRSIPSPGNHIAFFGAKRRRQVMQRSDTGRERTRTSILLVKDEVLIRHDLAERLRSAGHHVIEARDADEASTLICAGVSASLLITDVRMPSSLSGVQLAPHVRAAR